MTEARTMQLLLWRHAEAQEGFPDAGRRLTERGEKQAARMAAWLKTHAPQGMRVLVSPAQRTLQTVAPLGRSTEVTAAVGTEASADELLAATGWPGAGGAVLVVGHQPTLGIVAGRLLGAPGGLSVRKGALWWFEAREREGRLDTVLKLVLPSSVLP